MDNDNDVGDKGDDDDDVGDKGDDDVGNKDVDDNLTKHVEHPVILLDVVHAVQLVVDRSAGDHLVVICSVMMMMIML